MNWSLMQRRSIWWPTWRGWILLVFLLGGPPLWWFFEGESYLASTRRLPAEVLVVEAWIGPQAIRPVAVEFEREHYDYVVVAGSISEVGWGGSRWSVVEAAASDLIETGIPKGKVITAQTQEADAHRTFETAAASLRALRERGLEPEAINVFTAGAHGRRSRLVFQKVFGSGVEVGVVSWMPVAIASGPWWKSSERAREVIAETAGFLYEWLLDSGRDSNFPGEQ